MDLPALMLAIDLTEISDKEGVLSASIALLRIDGLDVSLKGASNTILSVEAMGSMPLAQTPLVGSEHSDGVGNVEISGGSRKRNGGHGPVSSLRRSHFIVRRFVE